MDDDPYKILGVDPRATPEEIKKAYRRKAQKAHPDAGGDADEFRTIARAYDILGDEASRHRYDTTGSTDNEATLVESKIATLVRIAFLSEDVRDPLRWMRDKTDEARENYKTQKKKIERSVGVMERRLARLESSNAKRKKGNPESVALLAAILRSTMAEATKGLAQVEAEILLCEQVLKRLNGVAYDAEPLDPNRHNDRRTSVVLGGGWSSL